MDTTSILPRLRHALDPRRLLDTACKLIAAPSPTGNAGPALDTLANLLRADGFDVERRAAGHPVAPAVVVRHRTNSPGPCIQFDGHLDTVHLPFVPPAIVGDHLTGSGASDMKGGTAAAIEALRILRDSEILPIGEILLTAHDLHEAPWGFGQQLDHLIRDGVVGQVVLIPEPMCEYLPVIGRGNAVWHVRIRRNGPPIHEVLRPMSEPSVIAAGAELIERLGQWQELLNTRSDPHAGHETVFIGQIHGGEIYNQYPQECWLEGTRRWLPGRSREMVETEFRTLLAEVAETSGTQIDCSFQFIRDPFRLDPAAALVHTFQRAYAELQGSPLPLGAKPFVDDGNSFYGLGPIPAITHGPRAGGQHTVNEWVEIADLERVALTYALTAVRWCEAEAGN